MHSPWYSCRDRYHKGARYCQTLLIDPTWQHHIGPLLVECQSGNNLAEKPSEYPVHWRNKSIRNTFSGYQTKRAGPNADLKSRNIIENGMRKRLKSLLRLVTKATTTEVSTLLAEIVVCKRCHNGTAGMASDRFMEAKPVETLDGSGSVMLCFLEG
jgi:hypothetical protein